MAACPTGFMGPWAIGRQRCFQFAQRRGLSLLAVEPVSSMSADRPACGPDRDDRAGSVGPVGVKREANALGFLLLTVLTRADPKGALAACTG